MKISVIIPVKNGSQTLDKCLESLHNQVMKETVEIIILDSMSTDTSREIALNYGAKIVDVAVDDFNHGLTRNLGALHASGDLLFYTVQDAWLSETDILQKMARHFIKDDVQAVVGHQAVPWGHNDKNPVAWFRRITEPEIEVRCFPVNYFQQLTKREQFGFSNWDDVIAMYRKEALLKVPFRDTNYSEDWMWANDALCSGMKLLRDPSLVVYHYHHMFFRYAFKAQFIINYHFLSFFKVTPVIPKLFFNIVRAGYVLLKRNEVPTIKKFYWIGHNISLNIALFFSVLVFQTVRVVGGQRMLDNLFKKLSKIALQGKFKSKDLKFTPKKASTNISL